MKKTLDSGAEIDITMAPFAVGYKLFKAIVAELESLRIGLDSQESLINTFKSAALRVLSSDKVEEALWPCLERTMYKGAKINRDSFESPEARADFLVVAKEVCEFNLTPFYKNLISQFSELLGKIGVFQKSSVKEQTNVS